ncbi:N-acetylmuramoyl-L-alanine amidase [Streptomyces sp. HPF1205]|uniref:N-acetylmuramoyl-L-alanine amidase n=1 Tax=Streptomyces sp. HPF1205 TaxID=2873262 RepID=UPI001CED2F4E|nr:N-acetylmuramoyl-L-alanine amidase [Streptomyces sp. HPF1205]
MTTERRKRQHRRKKSTIAYGAAGLVLAASVTYGTIALASPSSSDSPDAKAGTSNPHALQDAFASAAKEFKVPQSVLMAVSYRQTLWESHGGRPSTTGNYNVMGLTQVEPQDVARPTRAGSLSEMNLSGDPKIMKRFNATRALKSVPAAVDTSDPRLHTLDAAAKLIGSSPDTLRSDPRESVRGAAALLKSYEQKAVGSLPDDAGHWYAAVERYSQSPDRHGAELFANRVFETIRTGASRVTADNQLVTLTASPDVTPVTSVKAPLAAATTNTLATTSTAATPATECPSSLTCTFVPAAFTADSSGGIEGNYNPANRVAGPPAAGKEDIRYIVVHDMEGTVAGSIKVFQDPTKSASAHYLVGQDGQVTQMVQTKDEAWHAANKTVNMHSVAIENEGFAVDKSTWYVESEYDSSAALVKYLAGRFGIPLDRQHVIGHDEVPGVVDSLVSAQHWDPGPYWDWNHFMDLVGAPTGAGGAGGPLKVGQEITIAPPFTTANAPTVTYNPPDGSGTQTYTRPANFVWLRTSPSATAPLLSDLYLRSSGSGTNQAPDWGDKAVAGGRYVVAGVSGNWTAIWYGGQKAWFSNPGGQWTAPVGKTAQPLIAPKAGAASIPVFGRAYPDDAAYSGTGVPVQNNNDASLTKYLVHSGEAYVQAGPEAVGDYYNGGTYAGTSAGDRTLVSGTNTFVPIEYNHRIAWLRSTDVQQISSTVPDSGATRSDLMGRDSSGNLWQYQGTGSAASPFLAKYKIGGGWSVYNVITALTPLHANGTGDIVARDSSGYLWYYQGSGSIDQPFKARVKVGGGWGPYTYLAGVGDVTGDGKADLIARTSGGVLYLYQGTGNVTSPFAARVQVGSGWNMHNALVGVGDLTGDGKADLIARSTTGVLYLYKGTGSATAPFGTRVQVGSGWNMHNALIGVGDVTGDGKADLIARDTQGNLWEYKGTGTATSPFATRLQVGTGWSIYNAMF